MKTVLIVAARCTECGFEGDEGLELADGSIHKLPATIPALAGFTPTDCTHCGGQVLLSQALPGEEEVIV